MSSEATVIHVERLLGIMRKQRELGSDALTPDEAQELEHATKLMRRWWKQVIEEPPGREADHALGLKLLDLLPDELVARWGNLRPVELTMIARAFPEELPEEARRLVPRHPL